MMEGHAPSCPKYLGVTNRGYSNRETKIDPPPDGFAVVNIFQILRRGSFGLIANL